MGKIDINLNLYRSFYYVAKHGGFTKASNYAMISQSSLSSNIKNLEDALNTRLFIRNKTSVTLTSDGKELYSKIKDIIDILDNKVEKKEINIGCIRFIADNYLIDSITKFKKKYKDIGVNLRFANTTELYQMLRKDEIDLILCRYPLFYKFEKYIAIEKVSDVENVFACSKKYYEKECKRMQKENYQFQLILPDSSEKRRNIEQYLIDNNINFNVSIELPSSNLLKKLILNDVGIGYINRKFIADEVKNGEMVIVDIFKNIPLDNITIIYNSKKEDEVIQDFIDIFKGTIGKSNS